jgi:hypothetical protein
LNSSVVVAYSFRSSSRSTVSSPSVVAAESVTPSATAVEITILSTTVIEVLIISEDAQSFTTLVGGAGILAFLVGLGRIVDFFRRSRIIDFFIRSGGVTDSLGRSSRVAAEE